LVEFFGFLPEVGVLVETARVRRDELENVRLYKTVWAGVFPAEIQEFRV
jgi:hypothetical protein